MNIADDNFSLMFCTLHLPKTQSYMIRNTFNDGSLELYNPSVLFLKSELT